MVRRAKKLQLELSFSENVPTYERSFDNYSVHVQLDMETFSKQFTSYKQHKIIIDLINSFKFHTVFGQKKRFSLGQHAYSAVNIKYAGYVQQDLPNVRQRPSVKFN